jgi:hypothetical protein
MKKGNSTFSFEDGIGRTFTSSKQYYYNSEIYRKKSITIKLLGIYNIDYAVIRRD